MIFGSLNILINLVIKMISEMQCFEMFSNSFEAMSYHIIFEYILIALVFSVFGFILGYIYYSD